MPSTFSLSGEYLDHFIPGYFAVDAAGYFIHTGRIIQKLMAGGGYHMDQTPLSELFILSGQDSNKIPWIFQNAGQYRVDLRDGRARRLKLQVCPLADGTGMLGRIDVGASFIRQMHKLGITDEDFASFGSAMDMLYLLEMQQLLLKEAEHAAHRLHTDRGQAMIAAEQDTLTGIDNRRVFARQLRAVTQREKFTPFALLLMDLDGFKQVNDQHGHPVGDAVLQVVAQRLRRAIRSGDVLARLGGDEFAAILYEMPTGARIANICSDWIALIERPIVIGKITCQISASIGICHVDRTIDDDELFKRTDAALYKAKSAGKHRAEIEMLT